LAIGIYIFNFRRFALLWIACIAVFCQSAKAEFAVENAFKGQKNTLVIGKVSNNPRKHYQYLKPIAEYAVKHMSDLGIDKAEVLMAKDNAQMIEYLKEGRVDWVTETAFSALLFEHYDAAQILLRKWKKDAPEYYTVFFTRKDSGINSIFELRGKTIALEDPGSTTAFFEPIICLLRIGMKPERLNSIKDRPSPDSVGYVLSYQEINSSMWVHKGMVDAGAFNNQDWNKSDHLYKNLKKDLKIIYKSDPLPRAFELVRADLDPSIKQRLKRILLNAHKDGKAKRALREYQKTLKFDELDDEAISILELMRNSLYTHIDTLK
jgi:phosphonate transport system substrate-binding protein